jgi:tetratricopeptide (TPR) repeat protein
MVPSVERSIISFHLSYQIFLRHHDAGGKLSTIQGISQDRHRLLSHGFIPGGGAYLDFLDSVSEAGLEKYSRAELVKIMGEEYPYSYHRLVKNYQRRSDGYALQHKFQDAAVIYTFQIKTLICCLIIEGSLIKEFTMTIGLQWERDAEENLSLLSDLYYDRANILAELKEYTQSLQDYDLALQYNIYSPWKIFLNRGLLFERLGRLEEAGRDLLEAWDRSVPDRVQRLENVLVRLPVDRSRLDGFGRRASLKPFSSDLFEAIDFNLESEVKSMLIAGASPEERREGITVLMEAGAAGHAAIVQMLLDSGAHVDARTSNGATALFGACQHNHKDVVEILIQAGADINARLKSDGTTALYWACFSGHPGMVEILLKSGAHVERGIRVALKALWNGNFDYARLVFRERRMNKEPLNARGH